MTIWLWIIGIFAFVWPVIVAWHFEKEVNRAIEINFKRYGQLHEYLEKQISAKISDLQEIVEHQDTLIALLWYKGLGLGYQERFGKAELAEFFHLRPNWYLDAMKSPGAYDTLCRYENYPWGRHAEWLRSED